MRWCWALLLVACSPGFAAELRSVTVERVDDEYRVTSEVWFNASVDSLYHVFLNFDLSQQFSSFTVESRNLDVDEEGRPGFYMRNEGCVWFFCKSFERYGYVESEENVAIHAVADAERSDFHTSAESWYLAVDGEGTLVTYHWNVDPKFWVPPLIGPYAMRKKLERDSLDALNRIETIARETMP